LRRHTDAHLQSTISASISTHVVGAQIYIVHIDGDVCSLAVLLAWSTCSGRHDRKSRYLGCWAHLCRRI